MPTTMRDRRWHGVQRTSYEAGGLPLALRRDVSRQLRGSVPDMSPAESQFLSDFDRGRYPMVGLTRLIGIARRASDLTAAASFVERLRGIVLAGREVQAPVLQLLDCETEAQGGADLAEGHYRSERTAANRRHLIESATRHRDALNLMIDALHAEEGQ
jgi:hypothetical protein